MERLVLIFSNKGDTVLDFCMGTASSGEACLRNNRNYIGIDIDKQCYKVAEERIYKAQHEDKGEE